MTDSIKCPFCGEKLQTHTMTPGHTLICVNKGCPVDSVVMKRIVWQALIAGKKAQDALKGIEIRVAAIRGCVQDGYTQLGERNRNIFIALELFKDLIKEITSITKQEE